MAFLQKKSLLVEKRKNSMYCKCHVFYGIFYKYVCFIALYVFFVPIYIFNVKSLSHSFWILDCIVKKMFFIALQFLEKTRVLKVLLLTIKVIKMQKVLFQKMF